MRGIRYSGNRKKIPPSSISHYPGRSWNWLRVGVAPPAPVATFPGDFHRATCEPTVLTRNFAARGGPMHLFGSNKIDGKGPPASWERAVFRRPRKFPVEAAPAAGKPRSGRFRAIQQGRSSPG